MKKSIILATALLLAVLSFGQEIEVINGHAHNDYENDNPLLDAIENGFTSVEVDIHLVNDNLYVSHDFPKELNPALTIESLYLNPLKKHILKNNGSVYPNYSGTFYLMIDFKTSAKPTYDKLKRILTNYLSIISIMQNGEDHLGTEVDLTLSYQLLEGLNADFIAAYLFAGDATYMEMPAMPEQADPWELALRLSLSF